MSSQFCAVNCNQLHWPRMCVTGILGLPADPRIAADLLLGRTLHAHTAADLVPLCRHLTCPGPSRRPSAVPQFGAMNGSIIVWDLETVPDLRGFAVANDLVGKTDVEVREAIGDKFPKHIYHSIVSSVRSRSWDRSVAQRIGIEKAHDPIG